MSHLSTLVFVMLCGICATGNLHAQQAQPVMDPSTQDVKSSSAGATHQAPAGPSAIVPGNGQWPAEGNVKNNPNLGFETPAEGKVTLSCKEYEALSDEKRKLIDANPARYTIEDE